MKNDFSQKKAWVTPSIEAAPVSVTQGGFFDFFIETRILANDSLNDDKPAAAS